MWPGLFPVGNGPVLAQAEIYRFYSNNKRHLYVLEISILRNTHETMGKMF